MEANNDYTQDGTVDLRGQPVLAYRTGKWKACSYLAGKPPSTLYSRSNFTILLVTTISISRRARNNTILKVFFI